MSIAACMKQTREKDNRRSMFCNLLTHIFTAILMIVSFSGMSDEHNSPDESSNGNRVSCPTCLVNMDYIMLQACENGQIVPTNGPQEYRTGTFCRDPASQCMLVSGIKALCYQKFAQIPMASGQTSCQIPVACQCISVGGYPGAK